MAILFLPSGYFYGKKTIFEVYLIAKRLFLGFLRVDLSSNGGFENILAIFDMFYLVTLQIQGPTKMTMIMKTSQILTSKIYPSLNLTTSQIQNLMKFQTLNLVQEIQNSECKINLMTLWRIF